MNDLKISQFKPDEASIDGNKIFIKYAVGAENLDLIKNTSKKRKPTIRNWNTVTQLLKMYEERK
jgi:uncharacterized protein (DUF1697 family)